MLKDFNVLMSKELSSQANKFIAKMNVAGFDDDEIRIAILKSVSSVSDEKNVTDRVKKHYYWNETKISNAIDERIEIGKRSYGNLDLSTDKRNFLIELYEEILDAMIYASMLIEKVKEYSKEETKDCDCD